MKRPIESCLNRTNVELKLLPSHRGIGRITYRLESNQCGIETAHYRQLIQLMKELESNQCGIETPPLTPIQSRLYALESNQCGIETLTLLTMLATRNNA